MSKDRIDQLLEVGKTPDWITPVLGLIGDFTNGPYCRFYVDRDAGWSANEIKKILKKSGIYFWGDMIADGMVIFTVEKEDKNRTRSVLSKSGVPFVVGE